MKDGKNPIDPIVGKKLEVFQLDSHRQKPVHIDFS